MKFLKKILPTYTLGNKERIDWFFIATMFFTVAVGLRIGGC